MHVAFIMNSLNGYGVQKRILNLARALVKNNSIKLDILVLNREEDFGNEESGSINIFRSGTEKISRSLRFLNAYNKKNTPDVIFSPLFHYGIFLIFIFKILLRSKVKIVVSSANDLVTSQNSLRSKTVYKIAKMIYRRSDRVVALTEKMKNDFVQKLSVPINNIYVINNPAYKDTIPRLALEDVEHPFFLDSNNKIVIGAGRLGTQKDFVTLIKAFALLKDTSKRLIILGEGGRRRELEDLILSLGISDSVSLPGFVENPYKYISRSDVFVLSSIWEGFGNILVEALACGTKVVSTNCQSGPEEILENGKYGILVPIKDPEAMATAIESSFKLADSREELIRRAQCFDANVISARYIECFSQWS